MQLYDSIITSVEGLCSSFPSQSIPISIENWRDTGKDNLIFRQDMAYELGGNDAATYALGMTAVTENMDLSDEILLIGKDLPQIHADVPYARIALIQVKKGTLGQGNSLYNAIKKMEFVRYHVNPEGFMTRVSLINSRESARVSKAALKKGLTFSHVGTGMLKEYHKNPNIIGVKLIFITDPEFPFHKLSELTRQSDRITKAIDHILGTGMTDCNACSLQKICSEVEGMKELHFGLTSQSKD